MVLSFSFHISVSRFAGSHSADAERRRRNFRGGTRAYLHLFKVGVDLPNSSVTVYSGTFCWTFSFRCNLQQAASMQKCGCIVSSDGPTSLTEATGWCVEGVRITV